MIVTINLDIEDINCYKIGDRVGISVNDNLIITLSPEAAKELALDISGMDTTKEDDQKESN